MQRDSIHEGYILVGSDGTMRGIDINSGTRLSMNGATASSLGFVLVDPSSSSISSSDVDLCGSDTDGATTPCDVVAVLQHSAPLGEKEPLAPHESIAPPLGMDEPTADATPPPSPCSGDDASIEAILKRQRYRGTTQWLVKYWGFDEPVWEAEAYLVEEGHKPLLDAFTRRTHRRRKVTPPAPPVESYKGEGEVTQRGYAELSALYHVPRGFYNPLGEGHGSVFCNELYSRFEAVSATIDWVQLADPMVDPNNEHTTSLARFSERLIEDHRHIPSQGREDVELLFYGMEGPQHSNLVTGSIASIGRETNPSPLLYVSSSPLPFFKYATDYIRVVIGNLYNGGMEPPRTELLAVRDRELVCTVALVRYTLKKPKRSHASCAADRGKAELRVVCQVPDGHRVETVVPVACSQDVVNTMRMDGEEGGSHRGRTKKKAGKMQAANKIILNSGE